RRQLAGRVRVLVLLRELARLRQLEAAELGERLRVLLLDARVRLERGDGTVGVALRLVRRREVAVALRLVRVLLDVLLRLRDGGAAAAEDVEVREELIEAVRARADAEEGEGD